MSDRTTDRPRVGVPWRTAAEESSNQRGAYEHYLRAIREAGGEPVEVSLRLQDDQLQQLVQSLDGVVLSGSPADVDPQRFGSARHAATAGADPDRERTDVALLEHALAAGKPLLAICYGAQLLNVHLGGSLVQDIPSEMQAALDHDGAEDGGDGEHAVRLEGGRLAELAGLPDGGGEVRTNSSHHQAILLPGRGLRVTAYAPDGVVEAIEWEGSRDWVVGVQWHPERMPGDALADALFRKLVSESRGRGRPDQDGPATS